MGRIRIIDLASQEKTQELGQAVAAHLPPNAILALSGDLGAGKTTFVQGLALGLGIDAPVQSPTFIYLNQYSGSLPLYHFDLYRIKGASDFFALGFEEYFDQGGVCAIEWPERIESLLPERTLFISFSHQPEGRIAAISGVFPDKLLDFLSRWD